MRPNAAFSTTHQIKVLEKKHDASRRAYAEAESRTPGATLW